MDIGDECVFTHGDPAPVNITVKDGNLSGIIDWEVADFARRCCIYLKGTGNMGVDTLDQGEVWDWAYKLRPALDDRGMGVSDRALVAALARLCPCDRWSICTK